MKKNCLFNSTRLDVEQFLYLALMLNAYLEKEYQTWDAWLQDPAIYFVAIMTENDMEPTDFIGKVGTIVEHY